MTGVSIVLCSYNGAARIRPTIQHLQSQEFKTDVPWEVIVVDNASTDNTSATGQSTWEEKTVTAFRIIREETPGLMHARRRGVEEAKYDLISFIDDDNWVENNWVEKIYNIFGKDADVAACGGKIAPVFEQDAPSWFNHYSASYAAGIPYPSSGFLTVGKCLWGAGFSIRRSVWNELFLSGFESFLTGRTGVKLSAGEDSEICLVLQLLGYRLWYEESLSLKHYMPSSRLTVSYLIAMNEGFGRSEVILRMYRSMLDPSIRVRHPWWKEYFITLSYYFKLALFRQHEMSLIPYCWATRKAFILGYLLELGQMRNKYDSAHLSIMHSKLLYQSKSPRGEY